MRLRLQEPYPLEGIEVRIFFDARGSRLPFRLESGREILERYVPLPYNSEDPGIGQLSVKLPPSASELSLHLDCEGRCPEDKHLRVYGFRVHYPGAEVEMDVMAVGGTTIRNPLLRGHQDQMSYLGQRKPQLFTLWYGTNTTGEKLFDPEKYRENQRELIKRLFSSQWQFQDERGQRKAACLVIGIPDRSSREPTCFMNKRMRRIQEKKRRRRSKSEKELLRRNRHKRRCSPDTLLFKRGRRTVYPGKARSRKEWEADKKRCTYKTMPVVLEIAEIQREVALELGCAFFDTYSAMGGEASIWRWSCEEEARAWGDLVHLSPLGYRDVAQQLGVALKAAQLEWQRQSLKD